MPIIPDDNRSLHLRSQAIVNEREQLMKKIDRA